MRSSAIDPNLVLVTITLAMTMTAGIQWAVGMPPRTAFFVNLAYFLGSLAYALPRILRARRRLRQLSQGHQGELAVAEYLDSLVVSDGVRVLHDIRGEGFNLDHVVIAPQGLYVLETKTISKPTRGDARVVFDGDSVTIGGHGPSRDHVGQAISNARWLRRLLKEIFGRELPVRPVLVYPGWFVETKPEGKGAPLWVLEPKQFGGYMRREPVVLKDSDVREISNFLKRYVRSMPSASGPSRQTA